MTLLRRQLRAWLEKGGRGDLARQRAAAFDRLERGLRD
jgi:hypothetical protein